MHEQTGSEDDGTVNGAVGRRRSPWYAVAVTVAGGLIAAACGGSGGSGTTATTVSPAHVEAAIASSIHRSRHVDASVTCPSGVPIHRHARFYCVAQVGAQITPFRVTETGEHGRVSYVGVSPQHTHLLGTTAVAQAIVAKIRSSKGVKAVVSCPADIPMQRGLPFACTAKTKSGDTHFEVRQVDNHGHVTYHAL
jgi:hypothetical protein